VVEALAARPAAPKWIRDEYLQRLRRREGGSEMHREDHRKRLRIALRAFEEGEEVWEAIRAAHFEPPLHGEWPQDE
jgi:hypothetical protein